MLRPAGLSVVRFLSLACVLVTLLLSSCGGSGDGLQTLPPSGSTGPIVGDGGALATSAIGDVYVTGAPDPSEYSEDASGVRIHRTVVKIVFLDDATVGAVNELLNDQSATIIAALEGFPALVVEIPDPGSLDALGVLVAALEQDPSVHSVIRSVELKSNSLPANVRAAVFSNSFPPTAPEWKTIDHHLSIRAAAAWGLGHLSQLKPVVVVPDHYGIGDPIESVFNIAPIDGVSQLADHGPYGAGTITDLRDLDYHGYAMLSIIAAEHSPEGDTAAAEYATGMVPRGIKVALVDAVTSPDGLAFATRLLQLVREAIASTTAPVIVNYSLGFECTGPSAEDPCKPNTDIQKKVINLIREVRHIQAEHRALFVAAAGNFDYPKTAADSPGDAQSSSVLNAATLQSGWTDPSTGEVLSSLENVLVVENAIQIDELAPTEPACVHESSFVGGHIAGIGEAIAAIDGPDEFAGIEVDGGTSQATAQLSGIAAYLTALDPGLTPQDLIHLLTTTANPLPGTSSSCTPLGTTARVADAYAAALATDPTAMVSAASARKRLALLDVTDATGVEGASDGVFDYHDLRTWADKLSDPVLDYPDLMYSRYDINGSGQAGGDDRPARFDLDISAGTSSPREAIYNLVEFDLLGNPVIYSEASVSDAEIVCYYANTDMYQLTPGLDPFTVEFRDRELERVRSQCDPCADLFSGGAQKASIRAAGKTDHPIGQCTEADKIVYVAGPEDEERVFVMATDGSGKTQLTSTAGTRDFHPDWSPDGSRIAYSASGAPGEAHLFIMNADGTGTAPVTSGNAFTTMPTWSPDGAKIALSRVSGTNFRIHVINADGSDLQLLPGSADENEFSPDWSPDGATIVYRLSSQSGDQIMVMNTDGSGRTPLTNPAQVRAHAPSWSPDGSMIAFQGVGQGAGLDGAGLFVMDADGTNVEFVAAATSNYDSVAWSSDSSRLYFTDNWDIFGIDLDGTDLVNLTGTPGAFEMLPNIR